MPHRRWVIFLPIACLFIRLQRCINTAILNLETFYNQLVVNLTLGLNCASRLFSIVFRLNRQLMRKKS